MFYPQEVVDQVIESNNIVDVIGSYVKLTKKGSTYFGLCPFHNEKTPSFSVTDNGNKQMYYCFGCHKGGTVLTFIMQYENVSYTDALKTLADRAGIALPKPDYSKEQEALSRKKDAILEVNKEAAKYFYHLLKSERGKNALKYLTDRGLSDETIRSFGLGYSDKYRDDLYQYMKNKGFTDDILKESGLFSIKETDTHDYFWNRVMFPIMDVRSKVIAFGGRVMGEGEPKYLNSPETICFNKRRTLYGLHAAKKHKGKELILCEGYMDVISLHQAGFTNAVASLGTALTEGHADILKRYTGNVVISYDSDTAGRDAALRAIPKLREAGLSVKVLDLSPYKDPDELIKAEGTDFFKERLKNAKNSLIFEIYCLQDQFDLNDPDEKTKFFNETAKRLSYIEDRLEQENYIQAVSKEFLIEYSMLKEKTKKLSLSNDNRQGFTTTPIIIKKKDETKTALAQCQKMVLSFLAEEPSFYDNVSDVIDESDFCLPPYDKAAQLLFSQLKAGKVNPNSIINAFEESDVQEEVADIFHDSFLKDISESDLQKTINDCIIRIRKNSIETQLDGVQDVSRIVELKKEQERLQKFNIFGRKS
ncbi:MAG: DNA primase [Lachnospiraceae bacterium]|nr:DNA primase [Lachnospiraceae bacterium]MBR2842770.1 DNA primase [Lachnospiraceae bacterium]